MQIRDDIARTFTDETAVRDGPVYVRSEAAANRLVIAPGHRYSGPMNGRQLVATPARAKSDSVTRAGRGPRAERRSCRPRVRRRRAFAAGNNEFPGAKEQGDDLGVVESVDETGELLGLVLDVLEAQPDGDRVQVEVPAQIGRGDDVLDDDLGSSLTWIWSSRSLSKTIRRLSWTSSVLFAPVQTIFPDPKIRAADLGFWVR